MYGWVITHLSALAERLMVTRFKRGDCVQIVGHRTTFTGLRGIITETTAGDDPIFSVTFDIPQTVITGNNWWFSETDLIMAPKPETDTSDSELISVPRALLEEVAKLALDEGMLIADSLDDLLHPEVELRVKVTVRTRYPDDVLDLIKKALTDSDTSDPWTVERKPLEPDLEEAF